MNKRNKVLTFIVTLLLCVQIFSLTTFAAPANTPVPQITTTSSTQGIVTYSDDIRYRLMFINGRLYKRLYNYTKGEWIGNWILVG